MRIHSADVPCPECKQRQSRVVDTEGTRQGSVRRRRACACGTRYTTYERLGRDPRDVLARLLVIAKNLKALHRQLADVQADLE